MNDNDICIKALTEWPEEARPKGIDHQPAHNGYKAHFRIDQGCADYCEPEYVVSIVRDAGLNYLLNNSSAVGVKTLGRAYRVVLTFPAGREAIVCYSDDPIEGTLLSAIDKAIRELRASKGASK